MSSSTISFFQADQNWYIQPRIWTLSANGASDPAGPGASTKQVSGVASIAGQAAVRVSDDLKGAEISARQLSSTSKSGYASIIVSTGSLLKLTV